MQDPFYLSSCFEEEDLLPLNLCKSDEGSRESSPIADVTSSYVLAVKQEYMKDQPCDIASDSVLDSRRSAHPSVLLTPLDDVKPHSFLPASTETTQLANQRALLELLALQSGISPAIFSLSGTQASANCSATTTATQPQPLPCFPFPTSPVFTNQFVKKNVSTVETFHGDAQFRASFSKLGPSSSKFQENVDFVNSEVTASEATGSHLKLPLPATTQKAADKSPSSSTSESKGRDAKYYERRQRNNASARRSREKRKEKEKEKEAKAVYLESQYNILVKNLVHYSTLLKKLESSSVFGNPSFNSNIPNVGKDFE